LGDPLEQVLREFQEKIQDKMDNMQAQMEDVIERKEKVIFC